METATGFDLEAAIQEWRTQLASQLPVEEGVVLELESHLRDAIRELNNNGLTLEESFLVASRRLGSTTALGQEFRKANPAAVWRQRVFWMVAGCLAIRLWSGLSSQVIWVMASRVNLEPGVIPWAYTIVFLAISLVPFALLWHVARSDRFQIPALVRSLRSSRLRLFGWLSLATVGLFVLGESVLLAFGDTSPFQELSNLVRVGLFGSLLPTLLLSGFLAWLMPQEWNGTREIRSQRA